MKRVLIICAAIVLLLTGCETVPVSDLPKMEIETTYDENGKEVVIKSLQQVVEIEEGMKLVTEYDTGDYDLREWRITDSKVIRMTAKVENIPEGTTVLIEHVHIDMSVKSTYAGIDGMIQDSMDDSYHGYSQDGFDVTNYPYKNIFAVQGITETMLHFWDGYGSDSRLTEQTLIIRGAYANKMQVVYDILIKYPGEETYHVVSILNEFLIPVIKKEV